MPSLISRGRDRTSPIVPEPAGGPRPCRFPVPRMTTHTVCRERIRGPSLPWMPDGACREPVTLARGAADRCPVLTCQTVRMGDCDRPALSAKNWSLPTDESLGDSIRLALMAIVGTSPRSPLRARLFEVVAAQAFVRRRFGDVRSLVRGAILGRDAPDPLRACSLACAPSRAAR